MAIMYLAYLDQEAERKRKREEEAKKKGKYRDYKNRENELNNLMRKGVRIPAQVIDRVRKQRQNAERNQKMSDIDNLANSNFTIDDLIDEM